jgi:hypothetical protein
MGIEPTRDASQRPANAFEDRGPSCPRASVKVRRSSMSDLATPWPSAFGRRRPPRWLSSWLSEKGIDAHADPLNLFLRRY